MHSVSRTMSDWNEARIEQLIADGVEESLSLEYKSAAALSRIEQKKIEITRDVSAFANSSGGILIYGVAEFAVKDKRFLPERIDPVNRVEFSKEWLEQIIQTIQPKIDGVIIHPIEVDGGGSNTCFVVEVPQSHTAHQARDHVYYKRHNFNRLPMEAYEVQDVMSRRSRPRIRASMIVVERWNVYPETGEVAVRLENFGSIIPKHLMVELEVPLSIPAESSNSESVIGERDGGKCYIVRLVPGLRAEALFPGSTLTLSRNYALQMGPLCTPDGYPVPSVSDIVARVYADEMPKIEGRLSLSDAKKGWTQIGEVDR